MKFSHEPILWIGFTIAILMAVTDVINGNLSYESLDAVLVAAGAVVGRRFVSPVEKK